MRLFDVVGKFLIKPQILLNLNEEYIACSIEEQCLIRRLKQAEFTSKFSVSTLLLEADLFAVFFR